MIPKPEHWLALDLTLIVVAVVITGLVLAFKQLFG